MITAKKFAANLRSIAKDSEEFKTLITTSLEFALFHARNHGQKTPFMELVAVVPGWLKKDIGRVSISKKTTSESAASYEAEVLVETWFASHAERKAFNKIHAAAKKNDVKKPGKVTLADPATVETETKETETVEVSNAIIIDGEVLELTVAEVARVMEMLRIERMPELRAA